MSTNRIASVNRLPPETLAEIFCLSRDGMDILRSKLLHTISLVCSLWRDIVLKTPQLWSNIYLRIYPASGHHFDKLLATVKLYLERSKNHPLTLSITGGDMCYPIVPPILKLFTEHSHRWEDVDFQLPLIVVESCLSNPKTDYPRLRSFSFHDVPTWGQIKRLGGPPIVKLFSDAPRLSKLHLITYPNPVRMKFHWSQITDFSMDAWEEAGLEALDVLQSMPNLVSARFMMYAQESDSPGTARLVTFPNLRLFGWGAAKVDPSPFFDSIHAQCLSELEFYSLNEKMILPFQQLIQRSGCKITNLTLPFVTSPALLSILANLPDVETLKLSSLKAPSPGFTYDASEFQGLGPRIKRIILEHPSSETILGEGLLSMIESRLRLPEESDSAVCRLESVHVVSQYLRKPDSLSEPKPIQLIRERISPEYLSLITYEERILFGPGDFL